MKLGDALAQAGIDAEVTRGSAASLDPAQRTKALLETVTVASLGAVSLAMAGKIILAALSDYLDRKAVRETHFVYWVNLPQLDENGDPVEDSNGKPRLLRKRISGFDAVPPAAAESYTITVGKEGIAASSSRNGAGAAQGDGESA